MNAHEENALTMPAVMERMIRNEMCEIKSII